MTTLNERFTGLKANKTVHAAGATAAELAESAGEQLAGVAGQAQQIAHTQLDNLAGTIRARPFQATGVAVGIGFVLALLARR